MTDSEAAHIIGLLAEGIDPETGEVLAVPGGLISRPQVIRALNRASRALSVPGVPSEHGGAGRLAGKPRPAMTGKPWSADEDGRLVKAFDEGASIPELTIAHERLPGGIRSRLNKLGRVRPEPPKTT